MIARMWHGRTPTAKADEYLAFLRAKALPDYRSKPGNLAAHILRRREGDVQNQGMRRQVVTKKVRTCGTRTRHRPRIGARERAVAPRPHPDPGVT